MVIPIDVTVKNENLGIFTIFDLNSVRISTSNLYFNCNCNSIFKKMFVKDDILEIARVVAVESSVLPILETFEEKG